MNKINIGTEINLADLLQSRLLIQANSGGGKSVLARVIIEETFGKVPFIVMDIEGEYYTLKELYGDVLIIGGQHADIPISMKSVKLLPKEIIANRLSVVIDLSDLQMSDRIMYAKYFLETMMDLQKDYWINYLVFVEEAHKLCGEQDKQASAAAVKDLMSRGRKRGYCGILLTQRISKLHKDAAAECNNKFIGRTFLDIDLDRSAKELGLSTAADKNIIRNLAPGNFYAFGTSIEPHQVHEVKVNLPKTKIPKAGVNLDIKPQKPTEKIKSMLAKLNDLPAAAEKELKTIQQLQVEVNRLKKELNKKPLPTSDTKEFTVAVQKFKEYKEATDKVVENQKQVIKQQHNLADKLVKQVNSIRKILEIDASPSLPHVSLIDKRNISPSKNFVDHNIKFADLVYQKVKENNSSSSNGTVTGGAMRMLKAAAMFHPKPISKTRMAALARLSHTSGSFGTYLSTLKREELITNDGSNYTITDKGLDHAGDVEPLPTDPKVLIELWCENVGNQSGAARMLRELGNRYPNYLTRSELGELVDMSHTSGSFGTYLSTLKRNGLIKIEGGSIKAADELFN